LSEASYLLFSKSFCNSFAHAVSTVCFGGRGVAQLDDTDAVPDLDARPEGLGEPDEVVGDLLRERRIGERAPPALGARFSVSERNGMEPALVELSVAPLDDGDDGLRVRGCCRVVRLVE
jgi:hypothetical protein